LAGAIAGVGAVATNSLIDLATENAASPGAGAFAGAVSGAGGGALTGALSGFMVGGPLGALVGGILGAVGGGVAGLFKGKKAAAQQAAAGELQGSYTGKDATERLKDLQSGEYAKKMEAGTKFHLALQKGADLDVIKADDFIISDGKVIQPNPNDQIIGAKKDGPLTEQLQKFSVEANAKLAMGNPITDFLGLTQSSDEKLLLAVLEVVKKLDTLAHAMSDIKIDMDGKAVGKAVMPEVKKGIKKHDKAVAFGGFRGGIGA